MKDPQLKLPDLVVGLERFGDRYAAIGVFADDLLEMRSAEPVTGLAHVGGDRVTYGYGGKAYLLEVFREAGGEFADAAVVLLRCLLFEQ